MRLASPSYRAKVAISLGLSYFGVSGVVRRLTLTDDACHGDRITAAQGA